MSTRYGGRVFPAVGSLASCLVRLRNAVKRSAMEYVDRATCFLLPFLVRPSVRRLMVRGLLGLMLAGSLVKELAPLPDTYLSNKRNLLNVFFVKFAWGWTFCLLLPFISITNYHVTRNVRLVAVRLCTLLVGTTIWYTCTRLFLHVEELTSNCYKSSSLDVVLREYSSKLQCQQAGGIWQGFDISGHSFLLSYCVLMILEEMAVMSIVNISQGSRLHRVVNSLFLALSCLTLIWLLMLFTTAVYFHEFLHKLLGTLIGFLAWYGTYKFWYLTPFSPGCPPQRTVPCFQKSYHRL